MTIAWLAHLYTASGAVLGFLAVVALIEGDNRAAFLWLYLQVAVDATDGFVARGLSVTLRTPGFDGAKLDDIVDYLCYVFVPALMVWHLPLVPSAWAGVVAGAMLISSAYGFNRTDAKTSDHFFLGFPSYWNVVVFYLIVGRVPPILAAALLVILAGLVFVPIRYLYPTRGEALGRLTNVLGLTWGVLMVAMLWQYPDPDPALLAASLVFPAYYVAASLALEVRRRRAESAGR